MVKHVNTDPEIRRLDRDSPLYPRRLLAVLRNDTPNSLYVQGEVELLEHNGIGFCGSRDSSDKGVEVTKRFVTEATNHKLVIISGNARGIDIAAHFRALESGGKTINGNLSSDRH